MAKSSKTAKASTTVTKSAGAARPGSPNRSDSHRTTQSSIESAREIRLDGGPLSIADVEAVSRCGASVVLDDKAVGAIAASRELLEGIAGAGGGGEPHYGINTGFGAFARVRVSDAELSELQRNLIRSHASGVGRPMPRETVRGMMLCLAASLSRGCSGVRPVVIETILALLNAPPFVELEDDHPRTDLPPPTGATKAKRPGTYPWAPKIGTPEHLLGVTPVVPEVGSCGASGDLAPLAHVALVLMGEGEAEYAGRVMPAGEALEMAGVEPIELSAKEGLALINGTHLMAAQAALACAELDRLMEAAFVATAMSIDACRATDTFLDERIHAARNQHGQQQAAAKLRGLLKGSTIVTSHVKDDPRVQDPYSLRCSPQVLGAVLDTVAHVRRVVEAELGAVTDNPLVFNITQKGKARGVALSGGNFHGMPMALALDTLAVAVAHVAGISERRTYHMLSGFDPETRLPHFLAPKPGLHSGYMIAQYASAACVNEIATLCFPASVVNLTTSAGMEDYNSWGPRSAAKCRRIIELARSVVSIELLCAAQAIEHHRPLKSSGAVEAAHDVIRGVVPKLEDDRPPAPDIRTIEGLIEAGRF